jgi:dihydrofolate reductase
VAKLIYAAITSLDGYIEDAEGKFDWAAPDEEVHAFVNDLERPVGTHLYGRRMSETMAYRENPPDLAEQPPFVQDFAQIWQAADKIVYSKTLPTPSSAKTRIEREFDPEAVRRLKATATRDLTVGRSRACGPGDRGRARQRISPAPRARSRRRRQTLPTGRRAHEPRAAGRTPVPQRHGLPPLQHRR